MDPSGRKGGKAHAVPVHHKAEEFLDAYLAALGSPHKGPLFCAMSKERRFCSNRLSRTDAFRMVQYAAARPRGSARRRTAIPSTRPASRHLLNGGNIEGAQAIAAHESPCTTELYDRTSDAIKLDEIERIAI